MYQLNNDLVLFEDEQKIVCRSADPHLISVMRRMCQHHRFVDYPDGTSMFELAQSDYVCQMLCSNGVEDAVLASPIWQETPPLIEGKYAPLAHQMYTAAYITLHPRCYVLSDCRLGKTGSAVLALDYLQRHKAFAGGVLIITTVTTMRTVWGDCIESTLPSDTMRFIHGKDKFAELSQPADWYLTNYDTIRMHQQPFLDAIHDKRIGCVLIDELTHVGNVKSKRSKAINRLVNGTNLQYVIGMTGSPGCRPEPVYGMANVINPHRLPVRTLTGWRAMTEYQYGPMPYQRRPKAGCEEIMRDTMQPAIRFRKEDVLDLPPILFQQRQCALSKEQETALEELRRDAVTMLDSGVQITAANSAVLMGKLLQVPLGFVLDDAKPATFDGAGRDQTIIDIVQESTRKVVIFSMFRYRLDTLERVLGEAKIGVAKIDGGVGGEERAEILRRFSKDDSLRVLVCHPTTVGFGTELSSADTLVLDGPPMLGDFSYTQTLERLSSPKQQADKICIIQVYATPEEKTLFDKLDKGQARGQAVAELFETIRQRRAA